MSASGGSIKHVGKMRKHSGGIMSVSGGSIKHVSSLDNIKLAYLSFIT